MSQGHPEFRKILDEIWAMHLKKSADYGNDEDVFANISASEEFGVPGWIGTVVRANDKMSRVKTMTRKGKLVNESMEDSLMDLASYSIIALIKFREANRVGD